MRFKALLLIVTVVLLIPQAASAQYYDPYGRRYDDGYRRPPPPPPPGYYYEERRYDRRRPPDTYRRPRGVFCAREGGYCHFQGPAIVRYGAGNRFTSRRAFDGIPCNNRAFGDPFPGADKSCFID